MPHELAGDEVKSIFAVKDDDQSNNGDNGNGYGQEKNGNNGDNGNHYGQEKNGNNGNGNGNGNDSCIASDDPLAELMPTSKLDEGFEGVEVGDMPQQYRWLDVPGSSAQVSNETAYEGTQSLKVVVPAATSYTSSGVRFCVRCEAMEHFQASFAIRFESFVSWNGMMVTNNPRPGLLVVGAQQRHGLRRSGKYRRHAADQDLVQGRDPDQAQAERGAADHRRRHVRRAAGHVVRRCCQPAHGVFPAVQHRQAQRAADHLRGQRQGPCNKVVPMSTAATERGGHVNVKPSPSIVHRVVGDEAVLVPVGGEADHAGRLFVLNEVGAFIWEQLHEDCDRPRIVGELVAAFQVSEEEAAGDLEGFIDELLQAGCLEAAAGATP